MKKISPIILSLCTLAWVIVGTSCGPKKGKFVRYNLKVYIEQVTNAKTIKGQIDKVVSPVEPTGPQDESMARKVAISRLGVTAGVPEYVDEQPFLQRLMSSRPTKTGFDKRWLEFLEKKGGGAALDAALATNVTAKTLEKASEDCAKETEDACTFMLDEGIDPETIHEVFGGRQVEVFGDIKSLQDAIRKAIKPEKKKGSAKERTVHVVLRQQPHDRPCFDILVSQMKNRKTNVSGLPGGAADDLASLVATAEGKITKIGLYRDDKLNYRLPVVQGAGFWSTQPVLDMLERDYAQGPDPEAEVEHYLTKLSGNAKVFGFTLPPADDIDEMRQMTDRVNRKYGEKSVEFYRDIADLKGQISRAVANNESIALIIRPSPKRAMDKVIARQAFPFLTAPSPNATKVTSGGGTAWAKWFEILWVWERKDVDVDGQKVEMLRVGDQELQGAGNNKTLRTGWVRADNVVPWRGPLVMRFAAQGNRKQVLFWNDRNRLEDLLGMPEKERTVRFKDIYKGVDAKPEKLPPGVAMAEPRRAADWNKDLYLLPVLDFARAGTHGERLGMLFNTLALIKRDESPKPIEPQVVTPPREIPPAVDVDIVFVMDLTLSMGPFVEPTRAAINKLRTGLLANHPKVAEKLRFGLWGYRDGYWDEFDEDGKSLDAPRSRLIPGIEFVTRNFTPELEDAATFADTLAPAGRQGVKVQQTTVDSIDYAEDMLAGVNDAILNTKWREGSKRFIILIGDAPGREIGKADELWLKRHPDKRLLKSEEKMPVPVGKAQVGTASGSNVDDLRALATSHGIYLASLYLVRQQYVEWYDQVGKSQFSRLAANPGLPSPSHSSVNADSEKAYERFVNSFLSAFGEQMKKVNESTIPIPPPPDPDKDKDKDQDQDQDKDQDIYNGKMIGTGMFAAAMQADMVGPVKSFTGWVWNRNPGAGSKAMANEEQLPLEPCVVIKKTELDQITAMLKDEIDILKNATTDDGQRAFLLSVRGIAAWLLTQFNSNLTDDDLKRTQRGDDIDIPYLRGLLPYESLSLSISAGEWDAKGGEDRADFLRGLESKVNYYKKTRANAAQWHPLRDDDEPNGEKWVTLIPLSQLP